jgi:hypothetical protein
MTILMLGIDGIPLNEWCEQNVLVNEAHYLECMVPAQGWLYNEKALADLGQFISY